MKSFGIKRASLIYEKQQYGNYCKYTFIYDKNSNITGCVCESFTNEDIELVSSYDLLEEYNMTQVENVWEKIIELAERYGMDEKQTRDYLDMQALVDYLQQQYLMGENVPAYLEKFKQCEAKSEELLW